MDDPSLGADYIRSEYARLTAEASYGPRMTSLLRDILEEEVKDILSPNCFAPLPIKGSITEQEESDAEAVRDVQSPIEFFDAACDYSQTLTCNSATPTEEAVHRAAQIIRMIGKDHTWMLSFCNKKGQTITMRKLLAVDFFQRTGWRRDRIIFCQSRTGSKERPLTMADMKPVENSPVEGPVYAPRGYGKGVVGKLYGLHALLDDKRSYLDDFAEWNPDALLLQAAWYTVPYGDDICNQARLCRTWDDALAGLRRGLVAHYTRDDDTWTPLPKRRRI